jgi:protein SCO1
MSSEPVSVPSAPTAPAPRHWFVRAIGSPLTWLAFFTIAFGFHIGRAVTAPPPPEPPKVYYQVPKFSFTNQFGEKFGSEQLEGKIWVANFIFTHCPTVCEGLTQAMAGLQPHLRFMRDSIALVTISVDPENDTPEVLRAYAQKRGLNQARWFFLTGDLAQIQEAVVKGFKLPMEKADPETAPSTGDDLMSITHGSKLVLVDAQMRIRGYYDADEEGKKNLLHHISLIQGFDRIPGSTAAFEKSQAQAE